MLIIWSNFVSFKLVISNLKFEDSQQLKIKLYLPSMSYWLGNTALTTSARKYYVTIKITTFGRKLGMTYISTFHSYFMLSGDF